MPDDKKVVRLGGGEVVHPESTSQLIYDKIGAAKKVLEEVKIVGIACVMVDKDGLVSVCYANEMFKGTALIGAVEYAKWKITQEFDGREVVKKE